jgi:hypothetical protein
VAWQTPRNRWEQLHNVFGAGQTAHDLPREGSEGDKLDPVFPARFMVLAVRSRLQIGERTWEQIHDGS